MDPDKKDTAVPSQPLQVTTEGMIQKYIRTYAGDMAIVQRGGIPDLAPLAEALPLPTQESPIGITVPIVPIFMPSPPAPAGPPEPLPPLPPPVEVPASAPLHTYGGDFSERIAQTGASTAAILAAELDAQRAQEVLAPPPKPRSNRLKIVASVALVLIGGGGAYFAYTRYIAHTGPVTLVPTVPSPIFVDDRETISGTGAALLSALSQATGRPLPDGQMRLVYDPTATTSDESVFNELKLPVTDILLRNIDAAGSMAGVLNITGVQSPFFILSVTSYGDTFAGMLSWEPRMLRNLSLLFPPYPETLSTSQATTTTATTTTTHPAPALTNIVMSPPRDQGFIDEVVANHDTRVYRDGEGRSVLIYGYWNQRTLIIARDEVAFTAILDRLAASRTR